MITAELHTRPLTSFKPQKQFPFCFSVQPLITKISTLENSTKQMHRQENKQNKTKRDKQQTNWVWRQKDFFQLLSPQHVRNTCNQVFFLFIRASVRVAALWDYINNSHCLQSALLQKFFNEDEDQHCHALLLLQTYSERTGETEGL